MRFTTSLLTLAALAVPLAGCSESSVSAPTSLTADGTMVVSGTVTGEFLKTPPPNSRCGYDSPTPYRIKVEDRDSSGRLSNFGSVTQLSLHCTGDMTGTPDIVDGELTWTNLQGDRLKVTYSGMQTSAPDAEGDFAFELTGVIDGGTGSFSGAAGELEMAGTANLTGQKFRLDVRGRLSLEGEG